MGDLTTYNAKRHFMRTPEPFGEVAASDPDALRFVVQEHFASRKHFDLRLEWNGVLMSWAVPEGPSLNTKDRRLAIQTEDHPVNYAQFEGKIPEGDYGAGEIIVWDQGSWVPINDPPDEALEAGELKFRLAGTKLKGGFTLVKLPNGDTEFLWIKERDSHVSTTDIIAAAPGSVLKKRRIPNPGKNGPIPGKLRPQLAVSESAPPEAANWVHEIKYDGYRTLLRIEKGEVRALTRNGHDWTKKYGTVVAAASELECKSAVLDGEVIVQDPRGASSFSMLQRALANSRDSQLIFFAFDLLYLNGRDLTGEPLVTRKGLLRRLVPQDAHARIQFSEHTADNGRELFAQACRLGLEGVVSKRADSRYRMTRSADWVKSKRYDVGRFSSL